MARQGNINVVLDGRGPLTLRAGDYMASGGEGAVYRANDTVVKLYHDAGKMRADHMDEKVKLLAIALRHDNIVAPRGLVLDETRHPIGFYMPYVAGEPMSRVFVSDFRVRTGFNDNDAVRLVHCMSEVVSAAHKGGTVMVDANELNWLVQTGGPSGPAPKVIDVDSWAIGRFPATVIMPSIRDWSAKSFDALTDWFAYGIVSFQVFTGIHPFKGKIDGYRPGDLVQRMKDGASVFDPRARLPHSVRDFSCIPGPMLDWYQATFQQGTRTEPPSPYAQSRPAKAARVLRAVTTATGGLTFTKLFERPGDPVVRVWPNGAALLRSGEILDLETGGAILPFQHADNEVVRTPLGWVVVRQKQGQTRFAHVVDGNGKMIDVPMNINRVFRAGDRLFVLSGTELLELQLRVLGKPVLTVSRRWTILVNSTKWFDGVAVQDTLGAAFVFMPVGATGMIQMRVKELDGLALVSGKAGERFAAFVGLDSQGAYHKIELTFNATHTAYTAWTGGTDSPDLNLAIITGSGGATIAATIVDDGELIIFVPANGNITKTQDRGITTAMKLTEWGDKVVYLHDGAVWRVRMAP